MVRAVEQGGRTTTGPSLLAAIALTALLLTGQSSGVGTACARPFEKPAAVPSAVVDPLTGGGFPVAVTDSLGRTVVFSHAPKRVVAAPGSTSYWAETLHCLQLDDRLVGIGFQVSRDANLPAEMRGKPIVCSMGGSLDWEEIAALDADLVIMGQWYGELGSEGRAVVRRADELGIPVLVLGLPATARTGTRMPHENIRIVRILGEVFDRRERAEELASFLDRRLAEAVEIAAGCSRNQRRNVLVVWSSSLLRNLRSGGVYISAYGTCAEAVELVGGRNAAAAFGFRSPWPLLGMEQIIAYFENSVDTIVVADDVGWRNSMELAVRKICQDPLWQTLKAAREGQVLAVPFRGRERGRPNIYGPRFIAAVYALGHAIYPDRFPDWKGVLEELTVRFYELD